LEQRDRRLIAQGVSGWVVSQALEQAGLLIWTIEGGQLVVRDAERELARFGQGVIEVALGQVVLFTDAEGLHVIKSTTLETAVAELVDPDACLLVDTLYDKLIQRTPLPDLPYLGTYSGDFGRHFAESSYGGLVSYLSPCEGGQLILYGFDGQKYPLGTGITTPPFALNWRSPDDNVLYLTDVEPGSATGTAWGVRLGDTPQLIGERASLKAARTGLGGVQLLVDFDGLNGRLVKWAAGEGTTELGRNISQWGEEYVLTRSNLDTTKPIICEPNIDCPITTALFAIANFDGRSGDFVRLVDGTAELLAASIDPDSRYEFGNHMAFLVNSQGSVGDLMTLSWLEEVPKLKRVGSGVAQPYQFILGPGVDPSDILGPGHPEYENELGMLYIEDADPTSLAGKLMLQDLRTQATLEVNRPAGLGFRGRREGPESQIRGRGERIPLFYNVVSGEQAGIWRLDVQK
jgi:hypothetical protein